jgi:hypothetical protein
MNPMFPDRPTEFRRRAVYPRGSVACHACGTAIHVYRLATLPNEFSLRCPACGARDFYSSRVMTIEQMPERRRKPRN